MIDGCVPPINATDEKKAHMYIYNNIFYSYSVDSRDIYKVGNLLSLYRFFEGLMKTKPHKPDVNEGYTFLTLKAFFFSKVV